MLVDPYLEKLEEWVERSRGKVRADVAHEKLIALGYTGSERTTRRAVAEAKGAYRAGRRRVHRPWTPEPAPQRSLGSCGVGMSTWWSSTSPRPCCDMTALNVRWQWSAM